MTRRDSQSDGTATDVIFDESTRTYHRSQGSAAPDDAPMDPMRVYRMIMSAAERQLNTAEVARRFIDRGLGDDLMAFCAQVAANASNPIADAVENAIARKS